ncbi:MAG: hypothetical protein WEB00_04120 [Dehalococcoidia bacterium]
MRHRLIRPPAGWLFAGLGVGLVALLVAGCEEGNVLDLKEGDCIEELPDGDSVSNVDIIDCDDEGANYQVLNIVTVADGDYPGTAELDVEAQENCDPGTLTYLAPSEETWEEEDDRAIVCFGEPES